MIHPEFILECIGRHKNADGMTLLQVAVNSKGTALARKPARVQLYEELQRVGLPLYEKGRVNFIENDTSSVNLNLALLHVKNKLAEYKAKEVDFTGFFCSTGIWAFAFFIEALLEK